MFISITTTASSTTGGSCPAFLLWTQRAMKQARSADGFKRRIHAYGQAATFWTMTGLGERVGHEGLSRFRGAQGGDAETAQAGAMKRVSSHWSGDALPDLDARLGSGCRKKDGSLR